MIASLSDLREAQYALHGTRKKTRLASRPISAWGPEHDDTLNHLIQAIADQVKLTMQDANKRLCIFTDALEGFWAGDVTQVRRKEIEMSTDPLQEWNHTPVAFVSSACFSSSVRWSTPQKELYAVGSSVTRLSHALAAFGEFTIFMDHKSILFMLSPTRFNVNVARRVVHKTQRWALRLAEFKFTVVQIPGQSNAWVDMWFRWASERSAQCWRVSDFKIPLITEE